MNNVYNLSNLEPLFIKYLLAEKVSAVTLKNYLSDLRHFLGWLSAYRQSIPSATDQFVFDLPALNGYLRYLDEHKVPESTVNRRLSTLRKFCTFCFKSSLIERNFLAKVTMPAVDKSEAELTRINPIKYWSTRAHESIQPLISLTRNTSLMKYVLVASLIAALSGYVSVTTLSRQETRPVSLAAEPAGRVLSFQGSLTDNLGNPVTDKTDVIFRLYTKQSGSTPVYIGQCVGERALTPDLHGIFTATIGTSCGMEKIPASFFIDYPNLYLGITVGSDPEMKPRQKIANVGTAASAQSLAGIPLGSEANAIPYIDARGALRIAAASPTLESTSGTFTVKGSTLTLAATSVTEGNINLTPSVGGNVFITRGNVSIGDAFPPSFKLQLAGDFGPSAGYLYNIGSPTKQWGNIYGERLYQNNYEVCDTSGNCTGTNGWDVIGSNFVASSTSTNVGIGTSAPIHKLQVEGGAVGKALMALWEKGNQDILVASNSATTATTVFKITNGGNIKTAGGSRWMPLTDGTNALNIGTAADVSFVTFDTINLRVGIGTTAPIGKLHVSGSNIGKALAMLDEQGDQDILVASASGSTKFVLSRDGNLGLGQGTIAADRQIDTSSGGYLSSTGVWTDASSRAWKTNFTDVDYTQILEKVKGLTVSQWSYKKDSPGVKHLGPVAEDFYAAFGLGNDNQHIASLDSAGIALAAVKGLAIENDRTLTALEDRIDNLEASHSNINTPNVIYTYDGLLEEAGRNMLLAFLSDAGTWLSSLRVQSLEARTITSDSVQALISRVVKLTSDYINVRHKISSPVIEAETIIASGESKIASLETNQIRPSSDNLTIDLNSVEKRKSTNGEEYANGEPLSTDKGPLARLVINGLGDNIVASIDAAGNATFSGALTAQSIRSDIISSVHLDAQSASIAGDLIARNVYGDNISTLVDQVSSANSTLTSHSTNLQELSSNINEVQRILAELRNQPINTANYQSLMDSLTASLNNVIQPTNSFTATNVSQKLGELEDLTVLGSANIYKAGISDSLTVGNVFVRDNSILSLAWDLNISSLSTVNFFGGAIALHKDGSIIANGEIIAQGGIRTNTLSQVTDGSDISVQLKNSSRSNSSPKLSIKDNADTEVASINTAGEGRFRSLALNKFTPGASAIIAAADNFARNGEFSPALDTSNYTAGEGLLPGNNSQIIVYNERVQENSLIYLTSTASDPSINLSITEKKSCAESSTTCRPYFKVVSNRVTSVPITFNWLLIN